MDENIELNVTRFSQNNHFTIRRHARKLVSKRNADNKSKINVITKLV